MTVVIKKYYRIPRVAFPQIDIHTSVSAVLTILFFVAIFFSSVIGFKLVVVAFICVPAVMLYCAYRGLRIMGHNSVVAATINYFALAVSVLYFAVLVALPFIILGMYLIYTYILQ